MKQDESTSPDGGPLWTCVKMADERRGLWYREVGDGTVQVRSGREGDDDIAIIEGPEAAELAKCLARVSLASKRNQPYSHFAELVERREYLRSFRKS